MTTDERIERVEPEQARGKRRSRWTDKRLFVVIIAAAVTCRVVVVAILYAVLVVIGQQRLIYHEALRNDFFFLVFSISDFRWWIIGLIEPVRIVFWSFFLVGSLDVLRRNAVKWRAGTHTFGTMLRIIVAAPIFFVASLSVVAWVFGFELSNLVIRVMWYAP